MIITIGEFLTGILGNGFIGLTNCIAWARNRKLCLVDFILTSLAFTRISLLWITIISLFSVLSYQEIPSIMEGNLIFSSFWILASHLSTWLTTCLAVYYFLKIANFSSHCFVWLKWRINKVVFMLPLVSLPFLFLSLPLPYHFGIIWYHFPQKHEGNMTGLVNVSTSKNLDQIVMFMIGSLPPFSVSLISFLLLLLSLWRHTKHVGLNIRNSRDASMEAHSRAMKTVFFFLVLFALQQFAYFLTFGGYFLRQNKLVVMLGYMIGILHSSGHSYVVIFGNSQMRKAFLQIPWHLRRGLKRKVLLAT